MNKKQLARYTNFWGDEEVFDGDGYEWQWYGTLKLPDPPEKDVLGELWPGHRGLDRYFRWFDQVEAKAGKQKLNWVRITECGSDSRFYVLFGGERIGDKRKWLNRWNALGGTASLFDYRPGRFCHYLLRKGKIHSEYEIDMELGGCGWIFADHYPVVGSQPSD